MTQIRNTRRPEDTVKNLYMSVQNPKNDLSDEQKLDCEASHSDDPNDLNTNMRKHVQKMFSQF